jgi:hypothetical protein
MGVSGTAAVATQKAAPAGAKGLLEANQCSGLTGHGVQDMPINAQDVPIKGLVRRWICARPV